MNKIAFSDNNSGLPIVDLFIINYKGADLTCRCLESIFNHTKGVKINIWVIDNNSEDGSAEIIREKFPNINLIENNKNSGFSGANNLAIRISNAQNYILLLNNDTILIRDIISEMVSFMEANPNAAGITCRMLDEKGNIRSMSFAEPNLFLLTLQILDVKNWNFIKKLSASDTVRKIASKLSKNIDSYVSKDSVTLSQKVEEVKFLSGACLLTSRKMLDTVGMFDDAIFLGPDDKDWSLRASKQGWKLLLINEPGIIHIGEQSKKKTFGNRRNALVYAGMFHFYRKHFGKKADLYLRFIIIPIIYLQLLFYIGTSFLYEKADVRKSQITEYLKIIRLASSSRNLNI